MTITLRVVSGALIAVLLAVLIVTQTRTSSAQVASFRYTFPHLQERVGRTTQANTIDSTIYMTYSAAFPGGGPGNVSVSIYLYDEVGDDILKSATGVDVCNPCTYPLTTANPSRQLIIDQRIEAKGGFPRNNVNMWALAVIEGYGTSIQGFVVNSHSGPFDLSITSVDPQYERQESNGSV